MKIGRTPREARLALVVGGGDWAKFKRVEANGCKCNILCEMALWIQRGMSWSMLAIAFFLFRIYRGKSIQGCLRRPVMRVSSSIWVRLMWESRVTISMGRVCRPWIGGKLAGPPKSTGAIKTWTSSMA